MQVLVVFHDDRCLYLGISLLPRYPHRNTENKYQFTADNTPPFRITSETGFSPKSEVLQFVLYNSISTRLRCHEGRRRFFVRRNVIFPFLGCRLFLSLCCPVDHSSTFQGLHPIHPQRTQALDKILDDNAEQIDIILP